MELSVGLYTENAYNFLLKIPLASIGPERAFSRQGQGQKDQAYKDQDQARDRKAAIAGRQS